MKIGVHSWFNDSSLFTQGLDGADAVVARRIVGRRLVQDGEGSLFVIEQAGGGIRPGAVHQIGYGFETIAPRGLCKSGEHQKLIGIIAMGIARIFHHRCCVAISIFTLEISCFFCRLWF